MSEWQPIETAPKDGTEVLLYGTWAGEVHGKSKTLCLHIGSYAGSGDYAAEGYLWMVHGGDVYAAWCKPTQWMPLPEAPC